MYCYVLFLLWWGVCWFFLRCVHAAVSTTATPNNQVISGAITGCWKPLTCVEYTVSVCCQSCDLIHTSHSVCVCVGSVNMSVIKVPLSLTQLQTLIIISALVESRWKSPLKCADLTLLRFFLNYIIIAHECSVLNTEVGRSHATEITCFLTSPSLMIRCKAAVKPTLWITLSTRVCVYSIYE